MSENRNAGVGAPAITTTNQPQSSAPLEWALYYASIGWHVHPIGDESKLPITPHGYLDATIDPVQITTWWTTTPNARVGLALRPSGLIAVDVDVADGKPGAVTFAALEAKHGPLPRTNHQRSGRGGEHIVMRDPSPGPQGWTRTRETGGGVRGKLGLAVDLKCNGYIVIEPSGSYGWLARDPANVADVPAAWVPLMQKSPDECALDGTGIDAWQESTHALEEHDAARLRQILADRPRGGTEREGATCAAIKAVFHAFGQSIEDGAPYIVEWNSASPEPHTASDLQRQVCRVAKLPDDDERGWIPALAREFSWVGAVANANEPSNSWEQALEIAFDDVRAALGTSDHRSSARAPLFVGAADLFGRTYPTTQWLVTGVMTRGGLAMLGAEPKSGKTWLATEIAVAVATGTKVCGEFHAERGAVAYFFAEDLAIQVRNRLRALARGRGMSPDDLGNLYVCPRGQFLDVTRDEDLAWIVASCRNLGKLDLVVLDPLRDISSAAEDKSDEMSPVMRRLRLLGELLGCTVAVAHHASKPSNDTAKRRPGQRMRGSSAIYGSTDSGIYFGIRGGDAVARFEIDVDVEIKGARSAGHFGLVLAIEDDADGAAIRAGWTVARTEPAAKPGKAQDASDDEALLVAIRTEHAAGRTYTRRQWREKELRSLHEVPETRAAMALTRLLDKVKRPDGVTTIGTDPAGFGVRYPHVVPRVAPPVV